MNVFVCNSNNDVLHDILLMHYYYYSNSSERKYIQGKNFFFFFPLWNNQIFVAEREPLLSVALFCCTQLAHTRGFLSIFFKAVLNVITVSGSLLVQKK